MYHRSQSSAQLLDSQQHGADAELLLVEGESAARAVVAARNPRLQAVLPLQGKPLNAYKASAAKVQVSPLYAQLAAALGLGSATDAVTASALPQLPFGRLVLLFDPDADGIHIGALVLLYLHRWQPELLKHQYVWMVRPPMGAVQLTDSDTGEITTQHAYSREHLLALQKAMPPEKSHLASSQVYRGLGSMPPEILRETCIDPDTRHAHAVAEKDLQAVIEVFGGAALPPAAS